MLSLTNSATDEAYLQHVPGLSILGLFIHLMLILLQCKWMRLNKHDRILLCSQKFATWRSLRLRNKDSSWCLIAKLHCLSDLHFSSPSTNLFRELRESPQIPQERCMTVRTSCAPIQEITSDFRKKLASPAEKIGFCCRSADLYPQVSEKCTDHLSLLYILILGIQSKFARKNNFLALGVCCPNTTKCVQQMRTRNWNWVSRSNPSRLVDK